MNALVQQLVELRRLMRFAYSHILWREHQLYRDLNRFRDELLTDSRHERREKADESLLMRAVK